MVSGRRFARAGFCFVAASFVVIIAAGASAKIGASSSQAGPILEQRYPPESLARGEQGTVHFAVDLDTDARIQSCVVAKSSGYPLLDAATCDLIVMHGKFAPAAAGGKRVATTRTGQIHWTLPAKYRANSRLAPVPVAITPEQLETKRIICRSHRSPGSLVRNKTYCLTRSEWAITESDAQLIVDQMINPVSTPHGCTGNPDC